MADTVIFLTSGTSFIRPADWNNAANKIEAIGAGGDSTVALGGRPGGCYAKITNFTCPATLTYQIGVHGGTTGSGTGPTSNTWVKDASTLVAAGITNVTTNCVGSTVFAGGAGGGVGNGGGGAAGPNGAGNANSGTTGGQGDSTFGGAGGTPGNPGNAGAAGAEWTSNPGGATAGSGGGGGANNVAGAGGAGGLYGGGAGADVSSGAANGGGGLIVITYTPLPFSWNENDRAPTSIRKKYRQLDEVVAPVAPALPKTISGLVLWFDASDASSITASGGAISQWLDKSGSAIVASQSTAGLKPTVLTKAQNSLNTVRFTAASSQTLTFGSTVTVDPSYSIYAVVKRSGASTWGHTVGTTGFILVNCYRGDNNNIEVQNSTTVGYTSSPVAENGLYNIVGSQWNVSTPTVRFNLATLGTGTYGSATSGAQLTNIGALASTYSDASVCEILVYNKALSGAEQALVEQYLQAKWDTGRPPTSWIAQEDTAPRKKVIRGFNETVHTIVPPAPAAPNFGWNANDAPTFVRRKYRQLDEVVVAPSPLGLPAPLIGWLTSTDTPRIYKRVRSLDEVTFPPQTPPTAPPPSFGWNTNDDTPRMRVKYRQLDETQERVRHDLPVPHALTDTFGEPLTDTLGVQLTDVFGVVAAKVIFLTSGTTFARPADWNDSSNTIEAIGAGADSSGTTGAPAGCYAKISNYVLPSTFTYQIGIHGGTTGAGTAPTANTWGTDAATIVAAGSANVTTNCVGAVVFAGGGSGAGFGGGGAAGPHGAGVSANSSTGGSGDNGFGGAGGAPGNPPAAGANGAEWTSNPGGATAGSGGGGGKAQVSAQPGGAGGLYGGAAGGRFTSGTGVGANGIIVLTYVPIAMSAGQWDTNDSPQAIRKKYRQLDEVVQAPSGANLPVAPNFGWNANDSVGAPRKRFGKAFDETRVPPLPPQAPSFGWNRDDAAPRRRRMAVIYEVADCASPFGLPAPPFGWNETGDKQPPLLSRRRQLDEVVQPIFVPPVLTLSTFWLTDDETAPAKRRYRQLDETAQNPNGLFLPPAAPTPSTMWMTQDETAPRKRRYRQLDETSQPIFQTADFTSFGMWFIGADQPANDWNVAQTAIFNRRRFHQLDNLELVPSPFGLPPAPTAGWREAGDKQAIPQRKRRQFENEELVASATGLPTLPFGWAVFDEPRPSRRRYRQFDELSFNQAVVLPPSFGWASAEDTAPRRKWFRRLDVTAEGLSALGLPPPPVLNFGWASADELRALRKRFVNLDEVVIPLRLPPGLPVPVVPPPPQSHCDQRKSLLGPFVFGPNTPQLGDLAVAVLQDLGVLETGQPVAPEDAMTIIGRLYPKLEELNERDVAYIDPDNIANAQFLPLVKIMAYECASAFTIVDPMKLQTLQAKGGIAGEAEGTLKDIVRLRTPRQVMRTELFSRNPYGRRYW
jgi:hypothetical protein